MEATAVLALVQKGPKKSNFQVDSTQESNSLSLGINQRIRTRADKVAQN